jgi:hypothetical protein
MSIALIGGIDRLQRHYISEAENFGINLKIYTNPETGMKSKIGNADAVVIFTNKVSHRAKKEAMAVANNDNIPVLMRHSCGICTLRDCFNCLKDSSSLKGGRGC